VNERLPGAGRPVGASAQSAASSLGEPSGPEPASEDGSLAAGGALAAVLDPRQVYLLAGGLGGVVTLRMTVRLARRLGADRGHRDISFAAEQSRA